MNLPSTHISKWWFTGLKVPYNSLCWKYWFDNPRGSSSQYFQCKLLRLFKSLKGTWCAHQQRQGLSLQWVFRNTKLQYERECWCVQCRMLKIFAKLQESIFRTWLIVPFLTPSIINFELDVREQIVQLFLFKEWPIKISSQSQGRCGSKGWHHLR